MALYHFHVTQVKRSAGQSAVASAAYRAGEKLYSDYYGEVSDYTRKGGVVCSEILLPSHAPPEYADRQTLWNAVEKAERGKTAQLAYSFDIALQNEFSLSENIVLARQFLLDEFVSRGMVVDFAVHQPDKENGGIQNPHFHVLCPIRPIEQDGTWGLKQRRVYVLDENGERIRDEAGNYVFNAVPTTDWGNPGTLEHWRQEWAERCNQKFAEKGLDCRIDHRSFQRQGIEQIPTVHEGPTVRAMEKKGILTEKGALNRWIRETNATMKKIKAEIKALFGWLKENDEELHKPDSPTIADLLGEYYAERNAGAYSQKAKTGNLKRYAQDFEFLQSKGVLTVDQLHDYASDVSGRYYRLNDSLKGKENRMKELQTLLRLAEDYKRLKPIVDSIPPKGGFGKKREKYLSGHDDEIRQFYAVCRKLDDQVPDKKLAVKAWQKELDTLQQEHASEGIEAKDLWDEMKRTLAIRQKVDTALHDRQRTPQQRKHEIERQQGGH